MTMVPTAEGGGHLIDPSLVPGAEPVARTNWQLFRRRFLRHRLAVASSIVLVLLFVASFSAPWIAPFPKNHIDILAVGNAQGPTAHHWFGTTDNGQDLLTQVLYGGQISLKIGVAVALISTVIGVAIGAIAGFFGRGTDFFLSGFTDLFLIVPDLAILAVVMQRVGHTQFAMIFVLAGLGWTYIARVVRGLVLSIKEKEFVEAARASGASNTRIIVRHIIPNCIGPIMVNMTLTVAVAVIAEASLTFIGYGLQPPNTSWGILLSQGEEGLSSSSTLYLTIFPALFLLLTVMAVNFVGDGLRDAFDPRAGR